jgi:hypothetical protein
MIIYSAICFLKETLSICTHMVFITTVNNECTGYTGLYKSVDVICLGLHVCISVN